MGDPGSVRPKQGVDRHHQPRAGLGAALSKGQEGPGAAAWLSGLLWCGDSVHRDRALNRGQEKEKRTLTAAAVLLCCREGGPASGSFEPDSPLTGLAGPGSREWRTETETHAGSGGGGAAGLQRTRGGGVLSAVPRDAHSSVLPPSAASVTFSNALGEWLGGALERGSL